MNKLLVFIFIFVVLFSSFCVSSPNVAKADLVVYSDVLADLQKDPNFNVNDYPEDQTDYSLDIIQFAETKDDDLVVYVYQPSGDTVLASGITFFTDSIDTLYYDLILLSHNGVFFKYKVYGYTVSHIYHERKYSPNTILVNLGDEITTSNGNTVSTISYNVSSYVYYVFEQNGHLLYGKEDRNASLITITDKYCGQLVFAPGRADSALYGILYPGYMGSSITLHFIAFSFDTPVEYESLYGARVVYDLVTVTTETSVNLITYLAELFGWGSMTNTTTVRSRETKDLSSDVSYSVSAGFFSHTYNIKEVMSKDDFVNNVVANSSLFFKSGFAEGHQSDLDGKDWVLCLCTTENISLDTSPDDNNVDLYNKSSYLEDELILQLSVKNRYDVYTLDVIDNFQTGDHIPDNVEEYGFNYDRLADMWEKLKEYIDEYIDEYKESAEEWIKILASVLGVVLLLVLVLYLLPVFKFIFKIILAPFKWLFGSKPGGRKR